MFVTADVRLAAIAPLEGSTLNIRRIHLSHKAGAPTVAPWCARHVSFMTTGRSRSEGTCVRAEEGGMADDTTNTTGTNIGWGEDTSTHFLELGDVYVPMRSEQIATLLGL